MGSVLKGKAALIQNRLDVFSFISRYKSLGLNIKNCDKLIRYLAGENYAELSKYGVNVDKIVSANMPPDTEECFYIGLFWFTEDYSDVVDLIGVKKIILADMGEIRNMDPVGFHMDIVSNANSKPRGRISFREGIVKINVGFKCPDKAVDLAKRVFGVDILENVKTVRGMHWDPK